MLTLMTLLKELILSVMRRFRIGFCAVLLKTPSISAGDGIGNAISTPAVKLKLDTQGGNSP